MRASLTVGVLVIASLMAAAQAAAAGPTTQAQQLAAAENTFASAMHVAENKLIRLQESTSATACTGTTTIPKSQQQAAFGIGLSWIMVSGVEMIGPLYVGHARNVAALHLTDPALARYALALQRMATLAAPLGSAKPVGLCAVIAQWQRHGYEQSGPTIAADLFGLTDAQAAATEIAVDSNPTAKAFTRARAAAGARVRALGVAPLPSLTKAP